MTTTTVARSHAPRSDPQRPPNGEALRMTGRPYVSHSQLSTMRQCPRKFAFIYIENAAKDFQASSLLFGSAAHSAFEFYYRGRLEGLAITPADMLHGFHQAWEREVHAGGEHVPVRFNKGESVESVGALAERMIGAFLQSPLSRPQGQIVGVEEQFRVTIGEHLPDVLAKVDLVTQTDDALHVIDLKTSRSKWSAERAAEGAEQLLLYGRTVRGMSDGVGLPVKLHFAVITKAKTPAVQILDVPADAARLEAVHDNIAQVWTAAKSGNYFANPSPLNCAICAFKSRCPAFSSK